jgi:trehalose monomycolate/heme transporter
MFARLTDTALTKPRLAVWCCALLWPLLLVAGLTVFPSLRTGGFDGEDAESSRVQRWLAEDLSAGRADLVVLVEGKAGGNVNDVETYASLLAIVGLLENDAAVVGVQGYASTGRRDFVSSDDRLCVELVTLRGGEQEQAAATHRLMAAIRALDDTLPVRFGGFVPANIALNRTVEHDLRYAEALAFPLCAALLTWIFGNFLAALIPLLLGATAILAAFSFLHVVALVTEVSVFSTNMITVLGLGLSVDYALFLVSRIREEEPHHGLDEAIRIAMHTTGKAVAYSGLTVVLSLMGLFLFPQMYLRSMGAGGIAVTVVSVVLALTVLPALIKLMGPRALHHRQTRPHQADSNHPNNDDTDPWARLAYAVMKHPVLVATTVTALLLVCASPFLRFQASSPDVRMLPADVEARQVSDVIEQHLLPHRTTPHEVLVKPTSNLLTESGVAQLYDLVARIRTLEGVVSVTSVFDIIPGVSKATYIKQLGKPAHERDQALAGVEHLLTDHAARIVVVSAHDLDTDAAQQQVDALRALSGGDLHVFVGGEAARLTDLKRDIRARTPMMLALIVVVMFAVLFLVFGSIVLPLKAMIMNVLSLSASYGAIVWVFQDGRFEGLLAYRSLHTTDAMQPILMFAGVFGLSMDYEVLLLSRVREEFVRTGNNEEAVARGLTRTGRLITSAALLLVVVIGSFATSSILIIKQLGVGMALAIALDATIVRALLVPSTMKLLGAWNWWAPAPLKRWWQRAGLDH